MRWETASCGESFCIQERQPSPSAASCGPFRSANFGHSTEFPVGTARRERTTAANCHGLLYPLPAIAQVEQFHRVHYPQRQIGLPDFALDLQQAAGVRGQHDLGPGRDDIVELPPRQPIRHLGFVQVVDAGRAAAHARLGQLAELQAGNRGQQPPRGRRDALGVGQVAGVVVGGHGVDAALRAR